MFDKTKRIFNSIIICPSRRLGFVKLSNIINSPFYSTNLMNQFKEIIIMFVLILDTIYLGIYHFANDT